MRPQLLAAGILVSLLGGALYILEIPLVYFWSIPFAVGGLVMAGASFLLQEGAGPVEPPAGYRFCVFCSNPVKVTEKRCDRCNGLQPAGEVVPP